MPAQVAISPEEYLATIFEGLDREYVQGEVIERTMPTFEHGSVQLAFGHLLYPLRRSHGLYAASEIRMRVAQDAYRIADVALFRGQPAEVPAEPPLVVIEILSPHDLWSDVMQKLDEYASWGVEHVWVVDLSRRRLMAYRDGGVVPAEAFELPGTPLTIRHADLA